jgi:hypothetical protein
MSGYTVAWLVTAGVAVSAALVMALAGRQVALSRR